MKKRDFETYQKRFRDFEILPKFSETHVFRGHSPPLKFKIPIWWADCLLMRIKVWVSVRANITKVDLINFVKRSLAIIFQKENLKYHHFRPAS